MRRGEIVEDVQPPLALSTPLLLVKPPIGLSTPQVFRALDLDRCSSSDPQQLLEGLASRGVVTPELCVNDLEQPAFDVLPDLAALKQRLIEDDAGRFTAVFMTGVASRCCLQNLLLLPYILQCAYDWDMANASHRAECKGGDSTFGKISPCMPCAGSGSTIVCVGSDEPPAFLQEDAYRDVFVSPARLIARDVEGWYQPSRALVGAAT